MPLNAINQEQQIDLENVMISYKFIINICLIDHVHAGFLICINKYS